MTNRELLERSAKAAGIKLRGPMVYDGRFEYQPHPHIDNDWVTWNPLEDDGDAFRLMVKTGGRVECQLDGQVYVWAGNELVWNEFALDATNDFERASATRRAIVRAMTIERSADSE